MAGFFALPRGWQDHPALGGSREPLCRRAAWAWMVERARWKAGHEDVGGVTVQLCRGQFCASYRFLAEAWRWPVAKVQRFIDRCRTDTLIKTALEHGRMVVTICNYDEIQRNGSGEDHIGDTAPDTAAIRGRYGADTKEKKVTKGKRERSPLTPLSEDEKWRGRLRSYTRGYWHDDAWGPNPDLPDCKAPPDIIAEWLSKLSPQEMLLRAGRTLNRGHAPDVDADLLGTPTPAPAAPVQTLQPTRKPTATPSTTPAIARRFKA